MSNTNSYIVLTELGLSAVATQPWPQIAIKYFLPMYDERIDTLIHTEAGLTSAVPLSASITSADTQASLIGERIYNIPSTSGTYQLTTKNVASSASGSSFAPPETIVASTVNKGCSRTLINGKALSPVVSGNVEPIYDIGLSQLQFVGGTATPIPVNAWTIDGTNIPRENLFDSVTFNPTQVTCGSYNVISGRFKFTLENVVGNYRFNKIAFFIQPMKEDGTVNTDYDPVLFGQAVLDVSQVIEVGRQGLQTFEVTIQLAFTVKDSMVVLTNNDYWSMIPTLASTRRQNGLFFAGDVALGTSSIPNSWQPRAKMHITDDTNSAQLRLSYSTGLSGLDVTMTDSGTSGMVSFTPTSGYSQGFGFVFGRNSYAVSNLSGYNAYTFGDWCIAEGQNAIAMGTSSSAIGRRAISIGTLNKVVSNNEANPFAIGLGNVVSAMGNSPVNFALGYYTSSIGGIAIGAISITSGYSSYAIGNHCKSLNSYTMNLGDNNSLYSVFSFALGFNNIVSGAGAYNGIIGYNNILNNNGRSKNWIFGADNVSTFDSNSTIIGNNNIGVENRWETNDTAIILGNNNNASAGGGVLVGRNNKGPGDVFGRWSYSYRDGLAIGTSALARSEQSIAIGYNVKVSNYASSPLSKVIVAKNNIGIGFNINIHDTASYCIAIGTDAKALTVSGYALGIGYGAGASFQGTAIGPWSMAYGMESVALGSNARAYGIGYNAIDDDENNSIGGIAIGARSVAWNGNYGIAIGYAAQAQCDELGRRAIAIGYDVVTKVSPVSSVYSMASIGTGFTNEYAGFMCGINPANLAQIKVKLGSDISKWTFTPSFVAGGGNRLNTNVLMAGQLLTSAGTKSALVLDETTIIDVGNASTQSAGAILQGLGAPKGTIFKGGGAHGVSYLYIYDGGV